MSVFKYNSELGKKLQEELGKKDSNFENLEYEERLKLTVRLGSHYGLIIETDHYSVWVAGKIYHWGPGEKWRMYGIEESNKEVTNEWKKTEKYNGTYFTLYEHEEIKKFCDDWNSKNSFKSVDSSIKFIESLVDYMDLLEFSS